MYALNFYSPMVADQLRSHRKTATIRLGDKSRKYRKGMVVHVLVGSRYSPREKVFDAWQYDGHMVLTSATCSWIGETVEARYVSSPHGQVTVYAEVGQVRNRVFFS